MVTNFTSDDRQEQLVLPNEIHGFLRYNSFLRADTAMVDYLQKHLSEGFCR
jgi:hypothetical protein